MSAVEPSEILAAADIADLFGVTPAAVSNWRKRYDDFPQPWTTVARNQTPLWTRTQIADWYRNRAPELVRLLTGE